MKFEIKSYSHFSSLLFSILFFVIGCLLVSYSDKVIETLSCVVGGILIVYGFYRLISYYNSKEKNEINNFYITVYSTIVVIGVLCIFLAGVIETAFRLVVGAWVLFSGINRFISAITRQDIKDRKNLVLLFLSFLLICIGVYILLKSNLFIKYIGFLIMAYSMVDIIGYIFTQSSKYDESSSGVQVISYKEKKSKKGKED